MSDDHHETLFVLCDFANLLKERGKLEEALESALQLVRNAPEDAESQESALSIQEEIEAELSAIRAGEGEDH